MNDAPLTHHDRAETILDALRKWWGLPPRHPADDDHSEMRLIRTHLDAVRAEAEAERDALRAQLAAIREAYQAHQAAMARHIEAWSNNSDREAEAEQAYYAAGQALAALMREP